jgi:adenylate cyclase
MSTKILVVDDEPDLETLLTQRFRRAIRKGELTFVFAENGKEALSKLEEHPDTIMVLSDINMPVMDGITLLGHLGEVDPMLKAVVVSAYGDMDNIRAAMNRGAFDFITKPIEFGDLDVTMNKALKASQELRDATQQRAAAERAKANLARYFPPNLVDMLASEDAHLARAREQNVAVLFVDIVGFSSLTNRHAPPELFNLLRRFLGRMGHQVFEFGGTLDKYLGDGLMAHFGTPEPTDRDATNALNCAMAMDRRMRKWNAELLAMGEEPLSIAIGIHYGPVLFGHVGTDHRLEFAAIGDTVNVASRLETMARPLSAPVVVSQSVVDRIREENPEGLPALDAMVERGEHKLRGMDMSVEVWTAGTSQFAGWA